MADDELLPKNHPLQLYLEELNIVDEGVDNEKGLQDSSWKNFLSKHFQLVVTQALSVIHPWAFGFAEKSRQRILRSATDFIDEEDSMIMQHVYNSTCLQNEVVSLLLLVSFGVVLPAIVIVTGSSKSLSAAGCLCLFSCVFILLCALCLFIVHRQLRSCSNHLNLVHVPLKLCLSFLQEFDHHWSFGTNRLSLLFGQTHWSFPTLQKQLGICLQFHNRELIFLSSQLNDIIKNTRAFSCGLSSSELGPLLERVWSSQQTFTLRELKMLREVELLLESDFRSKVMGLICVTPIHSVVTWVRLIFLLRDFFWSLNSIREPLDRLDRLREYVQNGGSDSAKQENSPTASKDFEDHRIPLHGPVNLLTRTVFMRLLCAVKISRHLEELAKIGDSSDDWIPLLNGLRCQLDSCTASLEELQNLLLPNMMTEADGETGSGTEKQQECFAFQSLEQACARTTLAARDIDPEDDVLEDVAVGEDSGDEDKLESAYDEDNVVVSTIIPLHSSVLKELRSALVYRRINMEEREQKALRKRTLALPAATAVSFEADASKDEKPPESPSTSSYAKPPDTQSGGNLVDAETSPIGTSLNEGIHLDAFFSTSSANDSIPLVSVQRQLLRRCSWEVRSAVAKRTDLFRRTFIRSSSLANEEASDTYPPVSILPPVTSGVTGMSLSGSVSCSLLSPRIPDTGPPLRPFRPDGSFASALQAQRRKIGCSEEESFVAIGTGEEEIPDSIISNDNLATRNVLFS